MAVLLCGLVACLTLGPLLLLWHTRQGTRARKRAVEAFVRGAHGDERYELAITARSSDESTVVRGKERWAERVELSYRSPRIPTFLRIPWQSYDADHGPPLTRTLLHEISPKLCQRIEQLWVTMELGISEGVVSHVITVNESLDPAEIKRSLRMQRDVVLRCIKDLEDLSARVPKWLGRRYAGNRGSSIGREALQLLCDHYPDHDSCQRACELALGSPKVDEQLRGALGLGRVGVARLPDGLDPGGLPDDLLCDALKRLPGLMEEERLLALLERVLRRPSARVLKAALSAYRRVQQLPAQKTMRALVLRSTDSAIIEVAVEELGHRRDASTEPTLLELLKRRAPIARAEHQPLPTVIVRALGRCGTASAVSKLRRLSQSATCGPALKRECETSIARIQARLQDAGVGGLALAELDERGSLALAQDDGALSLVGQGDGRRKPEDG